MMTEKTKETLSFTVNDVIRLVAYTVVVVCAFSVVQSLASRNRDDISTLENDVIPKIQEKNIEQDRALAAGREARIERKGEFNMLRADLDQFRAEIKNSNSISEQLLQELRRLEPREDT